MSVKIRPIVKTDVEICGKIGFKAHNAISSAHGYPSEQPSEEYAIGLLRMLLDNPNSYGFLAEKRTHRFLVVFSFINFLHHPSQ